MLGYIISLNGNTLYLSKSDSPDEIFSSKISDDVVKGSLILNETLFSESLGQLILDSYGEKAAKLPFNFVVEPEDVHLSFLTITKKDKNDDVVLMHEASKKLAAFALTLDDVYFSYKKIAPFVFQFIAIKKDILDKYVEVSTNLGFELKSIVPWISILPKAFIKDGKPTIFLVDNGVTKSLVLTELGGVYHVGNLEKGIKEDSIADLVKELSIYQRKDPINTVYTYNMPDLELKGGFDVSKLDFQTVHELLISGIDFDLSDKQVNLLNLFPVPAVVKNNSLVYVGSAVAVALLIGGFVFLRPFNFNVESHELAQGDASVLSESKEATSSEEEIVEETSVVEEEKVEEPAVELNRAYLKIRVENGTSVAGLAGKTRDHLTPFGYEIVSVGDSVKSDVVTTIVEMSKDTLLYSDLLKEDLVLLYDAVEFKTLPDGSYDYDVLITAGSNLK